MTSNSMFPFALHPILTAEELNIPRNIALTFATTAPKLKLIHLCTYCEGANNYHGMQIGAKNYYIRNQVHVNQNWASTKSGKMKVSSLPSLPRTHSHCNLPSFRVLSLPYNNLWFSLNILSCLKMKKNKQISNSFYLIHKLNRSVLRILVTDKPMTKNNPKLVIGFSKIS